MTTTDVVAKSFLWCIVVGVIWCSVSAMLIPVNLWGLAVLVPLALIGVWWVAKWVAIHYTWIRVRWRNRRLIREFKRELEEETL